MPSKHRKILLLGSGALKIGEAGEFDYSGSQAIKALKEEKAEVILINPNIATIQTSEGLADKIYFLPVDAYFAEKVIEKERPDGILLAFGGQTALNCGVELNRRGVLKKYNVKVLGTAIEAIEKTEDRELFKQFLTKIGLKIPKSIACKNKEIALVAAKKIKYPVIVRAAYSLGGLGSGIAYKKDELEILLDSAFSYSNQVLIEECLKGWKEVEYEVVRDAYDNCVTVCNMENFDPLGIHTGESIVIAPSQTLTNYEYHMLRELSIKAIREIGIIGECNIQFALDPYSHDYRVIEVNARLSRSSALASKATGYPLAYIAAKLAFGYRLSDLKNSVTKNTSAFFEPALDYVALKIPRWDLDKFRMVSYEISSQMKSVGEIMALGRSFEEVVQKGLRMLQIGLHGLVANQNIGIEPGKLTHELTYPTPRRILAIAEALRRRWSSKKIAKLTNIDLWFIDKLKNIVDFERDGGVKEGRGWMLRAKKLGFSDKQIGNLLGKHEVEIRAMRKKMNVAPVIKQIDTMAAEWPAKTNYLYLTYHGDGGDLGKSKKRGRGRIIVLGSGAYCIGSSVEFDWCCVNALRAAKKRGYETIMINYNPETVSTDYDICDKLYFDELSFERVMDIYEAEKADGIIISTGGQIPNNLALKLHKAGAKILGTSPESIDRAEDRNKFSAILDKLGIDQPKWKKLAAVSEIAKFANEVGYPVLVRPSYVLSGAAMSVAHNENALNAFLNKA
ncbi:carbamoyl-phosphate synthase (glutamine-hydrolyzing) large subunit, partial [Candidatus Peregrinibacteria bacterium]|nr:carbamoyl-phosphate synthase (glutamine-hydrolyzing) large subunit [Candidatus Peregrinibacteria bacterium]